MGCGASSKMVDGVEFINGKPDFKYDKITKTFDEGNGLLFRMVNNKKQQWAYYNDTTDKEMHVKVTFKEGCYIKSLGKTSIVSEPENGSQVASVVVYPGETELFIEGTTTGGFQANVEAQPVSDEYRAAQAEKNNNKKK